MVESNKDIIKSVLYHLDCIDVDGFDNHKIKEEIKRLLKIIRGRLYKKEKKI
jgi:hypothetical protein